MVLNILSYSGKSLGTPSQSSITVNSYVSKRWPEKFKGEKKKRGMIKKFAHPKRFEFSDDFDQIVRPKVAC